MYLLKGVGVLSIKVKDKNLKRQQKNQDNEHSRNKLGDEPFL